MSEIEKMYENAGFQKKRKCEWDKDKESCFHSGFVTCDKCTVKIEKTYSPFTTWKQLEILCFIVNKKHSVTFHNQSFGGDKLTLEKIQEDLAWAVNRIWQDLTEEEKEAMRGILRA